MRKRKRKKRLIQITVISISFIALLFIATLIYMEMKPIVANAVIVEAGTSNIDIAQFMLEKDRSGSFITDIDKLNLSAPGVYDIQIKVNSKVHTSKLEVIDTIAPTADTIAITALMNEKLKASDFVTNVVDATDVNSSFVSEPDTSIPGEKVVEIILEDTGNNTSIVEARLLVLDVKSSIQVEAGSVLDIKSEDFVDNDSIGVDILSDLAVLDISQPAVHVIQINVDGRILNTNIDVVDTTPPSATPVNKETWRGDELSPIEFVSKVIDISPYRASFLETPNFEAIGSNEITVIVEDYYGNKTEIRPILTVKEDTEPPVFYGINDKTVFEGRSVSYKKGVSVKDNRDGEVDYQIDSSKVNLNEEGSYTVYYTAVDAAGNEVTETARITVVPSSVTEEMLYDKVDPILEDITLEDMTQREIAYEIYKWIKAHVSYTGSSDKSDWVKEAYNGITNGVGDCFTYYAISEAFLTSAGIENMRVTRVGGRTQHFWNLINCGDGWYHFDTCPHKDKIQSFMLTDAEVEAYTIKRGNNYYTFDKTLYPATPEN